MVFPVLKPKGPMKGTRMVGWLVGNYEKMDPIENQPA